MIMGLKGDVQPCTMEHKRDWQPLCDAFR